MHYLRSSACVQFGGQAPGTSDEERQYAYRKFGFEFPMMVSMSLCDIWAHVTEMFLLPSFVSL
jgi:glutathione peroxidase-family protein